VPPPSPTGSCQQSCAPPSGSDSVGVAPGDGGVPGTSPSRSAHADVALSISALRCACAQYR